MSCELTAEATNTEVYVEVIASCDDLLAEALCAEAYALSDSISPNDIVSFLDGGTTGQVLRKLSNADYDAGWVTLVKGDVGLGSVDNTSDVNKPVSTAQAAAIAVVQSDVDVHEADTSNPHATTKTQVGLGNVDNTSDVNKPVSTAQAAALLLKQNLSEKGAANGYAPLNASSQVPLANLPNTFFNYLGAWNALTNSPVLSDATGTVKDAYLVAVAGTQNLGSGAIVFAVGDYVIHNGTIWQDIPSSAPVTSVNAKTGVVTLKQSEIPYVYAIKNQISYNVNSSDDALENIFSGATFVLPAAPTTGETHLIFNDSSATLLTLDGNLKLINGAATLELRGNDACRIMYNGTQWRIF